MLREHTAGSPTEPDVLWTHLTRPQIAAQLADCGSPACVHVVEQLLREHGYRRRQACKVVPLGEHADRDAQFRTIAHFRDVALSGSDPVLSIDTKKRELVGNFYRSGTLLGRVPEEVFDHDYPRFADGVAIPHGIYDLRHNRGFIHLGTSHDTSAFACDCLEDWWWQHGWSLYRGAASLLLLCDGGGSNSAQTWLFRAELQRLANRTGLAVRVAHYPPHCSKYNPIERRLFCHVSRVCRGIIFRSLALVKQSMERAQTQTGLRVVVDIVDQVYATGQKVTAAVKKTLKVIHDAFLPRWNYQVLPNT